MASFKKKIFTEPIICNHYNDLSKDWYVFFRFKFEGKIYKYKRREGINRLKTLNERLEAIEELKNEIAFDLKHGWNPIQDSKRELDYNPYLHGASGPKKSPVQKRISKRQTKTELFNKYYLQ